MELALFIISTLIIVDIILERINTEAIITAMYITNGKDIKIPPKPIFKPSKHKETPEEIRERTILDNLEAYDGTPKGQIKV